MERLQRLVDTQERLDRERRWEPIRATRYHMHYKSEEEEEDVENEALMKPNL